MKKKRKEQGPVAVCQLRSGQKHPFGALRQFVPLGTGQEEIYRQLREAIPVLDAAVGKLVRLSGGFRVACKNPQAQKELETFLKYVPCGYGQTGIDSFLSCYVDSLLTYGRAVGEMVVSGGRVRGLCWGDVTLLDACEGESPMDVVLWGPDEQGGRRPLPLQHLLLFTALNPEAKHPYGVSLFRGMPFLVIRQSLQITDSQFLDSPIRRLSKMWFRRRLCQKRDSLQNMCRLPLRVRLTLARLRFLAVGE